VNVNFDWWGEDWTVEGGTGNTLDRALERLQRATDFGSRSGSEDRLAQHQRVQGRAAEQLRGLRLRHLIVTRQVAAEVGLSANGLVRRHLTLGGGAGWEDAGGIGVVGAVTSDVALAVSGHIL